MQISGVSSFSSAATQAISELSKANSTTSTAASGETDSIGSSFEDILSSLNESQQTADDLLTQLSNGEDVDVHTVMLAAEENDVNFRVAMAIRDKLVDAYREVMRMSV